MKRLALFVVLYPLAGMANGTFELDDPAQKIFDDLQNDNKKESLSREVAPAQTEQTLEGLCGHKGGTHVRADIGSLLGTQQCRVDFAGDGVIGDTHL